jgi:hypothetical protein
VDGTAIPTQGIVLFGRNNVDAAPAPKASARIGNRLGSGPQDREPVTGVMVQFKLKIDRRKTAASRRKLKFSKGE